MQCCAEKPTWDVFLKLFATFEPSIQRRHLRKVTSAKGSQKSQFYMLAFDWLEQTDKIGCNILPAIARIFINYNDLRRAMVPDCLGTLSSTLCQISALKA